MESRQTDYWASLQNQYFHESSESMIELSPELSNTPSLSGSPVLSDFDTMAPAHIYTPTYSNMSPDEVKFPYQLRIKTGDISPKDEPTYCNLQTQVPEFTFAPMSSPIMTTSVPVERVTGSEPRVHATSGRRRAQNRAAQRAFRERKEKHARDLEQALAALTEKHRSLETNHAELSAAYEKLKKAIELFTSDDADGGDDGRSNSNKETLRRLLEIIH